MCICACLYVTYLILEVSLQFYYEKTNYFGFFWGIVAYVIVLSVLLGGIIIIWIICAFIYFLIKNIGKAKRGRQRRRASSLDRMKK
jgi:uncharacterized membrane protein